jgi:DNA-binding response OmpR family regulator
MSVATKTILLIDPDHDVAASVATILEAEGYRVTIAQSLQKVEELTSASRFDLVITEALGQRQTFNFDPSFLTPLKSAIGSAPIILLSTYVTTDTIRPADHGLAAVVPKPFELDELLDKVSRALQADGHEVNGTRQRR